MKHDDNPRPARQRADLRMESKGALPDRALDFDFCRDTLLSRGGSDEAKNLYVKFRGREPSVEPLLKRRGLD